MFDIEIAGVGSELQGVGRLPDGRAVFVPGAIPGETARIDIAADRGRFCEASLIDILSPSPDRVDPACPHAGTCGGCQARHMRYGRTLALKRQVVRDALARIGGLADPVVRETIGCESPDRTRNKAEYPIGTRDGRPVIGVFARGGRTIVAVDDCLLQSEQSVQLLKAVSRWLNTFPMASHLRTLVTRSNREGGLMAILCGDAPIHDALAHNPPDVPSLRSLWYCQLNRRPTHALDGRCTRISGEPVLRENLFDLTFELSPQSFFQVNRKQAETLYRIALDAVGCRPGCTLSLLDAYCGAGTITLSAARFAQTVTGIEIARPAIENARRNAKINGLSNACFICADASAEIPKILSQGRSFDTAILDPPRKGADTALLHSLANAKIPTICYISCNPATLARDVKYLATKNYLFQWAQPMDMFPWTGHVETVVLLTRNT